MGVNFDFNSARFSDHVKCKSRKDVLNDMHLEGNELELTDYIIRELEADEAAAIKDHKIVALPYFGCIRIKPVKQKLRKIAQSIKAAGKKLDRDEYKKYIRNQQFILAEEQHRKDKKAKLDKHLRYRNRVLYNELRRTKGEEYAELFIWSMSLLYVYDNGEVRTDKQPEETVGTDCTIDPFK